MRIALIRQTYTPFGGAERFVERALSALSTSGDSVDITLIARDWRGGELPAGRHWLRCAPFYLGRLWRDMGFARCVTRALREGDFDVSQSHERIPGCTLFRAGDGVHATWLSLRATTLSPLSRLMQAVSPWHRYTLAAEARMFRHPNLRAVICNSQMVANDVMRRFDLPPHKVPVMYNGLDLDHFHPRVRDARASLRASLGVAEHTPVVLYVGSGFARKGVATLLQARAKLGLHTAEIWVVGQDKHQARYEKLARRLGLSACVRFFGGQKDVRPFYGAADVFALPTLYDPFPNAAIEALACGLPIITSTTCGAAELVTPDLNGRTCPARDTQALADALAALCAPGVAAGMSDAARASVAHLSAPRMAEQLIALYRSLIS